MPKRFTITQRRHKKMEDNLIQKSVKFEAETIVEINKLGKAAERDFSSQVRFMIKEYLRIIKNQK
jgi:hypothetical protein